MMLHLASAALFAFVLPCLISAQSVPVPVPVDVLSLFSNDTEAQVAALARVAAAIVSTDPAFDAISLRLRTLPVGPRSIDALMAVCDAVTVEGSAVAAIVGPRFSRQAVPLGGWSAATGVPVISHAATAPSLGDASSYPYFFRTCPSDTLLAAALLDALAASGIGRFTIVAQNDEYGLGGLSSLQQLAPSRGLTVGGVLTFAWEATPASVAAALASLAAVDARIIVVWASASQTDTLLRAARARGLVGPKRAWLLSTPVLMGSPTDPDGDVYTGLVSVASAPPRDYGAARVNLTAVLLRWQALEPSTYPPDGRLDDVYAPYVYDAVLAAATAAREAVRGGWRPRPFPNASSSSGSSSSSSSSCFGMQPPGPGEISLAAALRLISLEGLTGTTSWSAAGADRLLSRVSLQNLVRIPGEAGGAYRRGYVEAALWTPASSASASSTASTASADVAEARGSFSPAKPPLIWANGSASPPPERDVLRGRLLRVVTLHAPPFVFVDSLAPLRLRGVAIEVLNSLAASLGFLVDMTVSNRSYSALVDAVAAGEFDFLAADITINARRQKIVTLSIPWVEDGLRVAIRKGEPEAVVSLGSFLAPFTWRVWVMVLAVMAVGGSLFIMMEHRSNPALAGVVEEHKRGSALALSNLKLLGVGIWYVASSFTCADTGIAPTTTPGRLLLLGFTFLWLILVSSFTGGVAAALSAQRLDRAITGFDEIKRGVVAPARVGAAIGSNTFAVFTQEVGSPPHGFPTLAAALDGLTSGEVDAAVGVGTSLRYTIGQSFCELEVVGSEWFKSALAYAYPPRFPFAGELDQAILQLKESGATARIYDSYLVSSCAVRNSDASVDALDLVDLAGVFLIAFFFVLAATAIWLGTSYTRGELPRVEALLTRLLPCACLRRKRRLHLAPASSSSSSASVAAAASKQKAATASSRVRMSTAATASPLSVLDEEDSPSTGTGGSGSSPIHRMAQVANPLSSPSPSAQAAATAVPVPAAARRVAGLTAGDHGRDRDRDRDRDPDPGLELELAPARDAAAHSRAGRAARLMGTTPTV